jgi:cell division protein FtsZ
MTINLSVPPEMTARDLKPKITVIGVGGAGGNAVNNMIRSQLDGVEFVVANTDAQSLSSSQATRRVQLGVTITQGLGAGSRPEIGRIAAEEALEDIVDELRGSNMVFIAAGMGGGTGTGAAPIIARAAREQGILTVGVVTKPFHFEGAHRMRIAEAGIEEMESFVDTLIIIPNQNLFRIANEKTTFADAFNMADDVLYSGVRGVTDLMVMPGLINLDFADIRSVMSEMGKAMMGTGESEGERRALQAAEAAISNPLLDDMTMKGARGVLINITGGPDLTLFEVDEAANRIRSEVDPDAYIIFGSTFDDNMHGKMRVSVVATGMDSQASARPVPTLLNLVEPTGTPAEIKKTEAPEQRLAARAGLAAVPAESDEATADGELESADDLPELRSLPRQATAFAASHAVGDTFIPPAPAARAAPERSSAPGRAVAADAADAKGQRPRVASLFARVTGGGRTGRTTAAEPAADTRAEAEGTPRRASRAGVWGDGRSDSPSERSAESAPAADRGRRLGGVSADDRLAVSQPSDDLLDIPAFLRRQAN